MDPKLVQHFERGLDVDVRSGYLTPERVAERLRERLADEAPDLSAEETAGWLAKLEAALEQQRCREATWSELTTNDRITLAFAELSTKGVIALEDAGYTQSDGWEDVAAERDSQPEAWGAVFFHGQDVERGVAGQGLYLSFDAFARPPGGAKEATRLGQLVCDVLGKHGVHTEWSGSPKQRIRILPFTWQRRR